MRQILLNSQGVLVAWMRRPTAGPGEVLMQVRYLLIRTWTKLTSLRPGSRAGEEGAPSVSRVALTYLGKALRNPRKAASWAAAIARDAIAASLPRPAPAAAPVLAGTEIQWVQQGARGFAAPDRTLSLFSDDSELGYQAISRLIAIEPGRVPAVEIEGEIAGGVASIGLLDESQTAGISNRNYKPGAFRDRLIFDPGPARIFTLVVANGGGRQLTQVRLASARVVMSSPNEDDIPLSELVDQCWNVGYSAAGEVVAVGHGVADLADGGPVVCGGAGKANHAKYVSVPRNLVCRCSRTNSSRPRRGYSGRSRSSRLTMGAWTKARRGCRSLAQPIAVFGSLTSGETQPHLSQCGVGR